jgi:hypothetical protein
MEGVRRTRSTIGGYAVPGKRSFNFTNCDDELLSLAKRRALQPTDMGTIRQALYYFVMAKEITLDLANPAITWPPRESTQGSTEDIDPPI